MDFLTQLWIPILASAAAVWIASAVVWMAMPHHKSDHSKLPDEQGFINALRAMNIPPGNYGIPHCGHNADKNNPLMKECWEKGPMGSLTLWKTPPNMGANMLWTFITYLALSAVLAYVGWTALGPAIAGGDGSFMRIFRVMGAMGIAAYAFSHVPGSLWGGHYPRAIVMCVIDGVVYGLITGAIFAAMWPA
jgi:hypothetical protein